MKIIRIPLIGRVPSNTPVVRIPALIGPAAAAVAPVLVRRVVSSSGDDHICAERIHEHDRDSRNK